jgi:hypothetical protein
MYFLDCTIDVMVGEQKLWTELPDAKSSSSNLSLVQFQQFAIIRRMLLILSASIPSKCSRAGHHISQTKP